ncbi:hypothetical protein R1sor_006297 [Riccia sorocarpa]|uniref:Uncharacterized protein n=1 Tax=Riccia sorocarpa TaxID=122646 RepID=A0ABD3HPA4_9MARC
MERRTSREKLVRVLTVKRRQMEYVLTRTASRRASNSLREEKSDEGSSSSSSSSSVSSRSSRSSFKSSFMLQFLIGRAEFFPSCCKIRDAETGKVERVNKLDEDWSLRAVLKRKVTAIFILGDDL